MKDLREIFLQPECCADEHTGRLWCEDDAPVDCEDDDGNEIPWTRYVRADLHDSLAAEVESLRSRLAEAEGREQMLLNRCDVLEEERNDSDNRLAEAEALLREAAGNWCCYYCNSTVFMATSDRIDAYLSRKEGESHE